jgi:hypothetical protein
VCAAQGFAELHQGLHGARGGHEQGDRCVTGYT